MFTPYVNVGLAKAAIADNKMTTKMALNRALKEGDIDMAEQLSRHVHKTSESNDKITSLKQTYDKADKDELVLNRQLEKELSNFPQNKALEKEISKMTYIEKRNLFEELQLDNRLRNELEGLKLKKEDNKNIEGMSYATKKKLLDELPKLATKYKKIANDEGLDGPDLEAIVNKAVQDLIAALAGLQPSGPSSSVSARLPSSTVLDLWYPKIIISNQENAWKSMTTAHKDYASHGINKPNFIAWYQAKKAAQLASSGSVGSSPASSALASPASGFVTPVKPPHGSTLFASPPTFPLSPATSSHTSTPIPPPPLGPTFKLGFGLNNKLKFGNFLIDAKKLKHNVLSITNKAGHKVKGFPNVEISDNFKKVFTKQKVNSKKLVLSENERAYLQHLLQKSDAELSKSKTTVMGQPVAYMSDDVKELKDRLNVLIGELDANNDSPAIKDEISQIITRLVQKGKINREQAAEFMKTFVLAL